MGSTCNCRPVEIPNTTRERQAYGKVLGVLWAAYDSLHQQFEPGDEASPVNISSVKPRRTCRGGSAADVMLRNRSAVQADKYMGRFVRHKRRYMGLATGSARSCCASGLSSAHVSIHMDPCAFTLQAFCMRPSIIAERLYCETSHGISHLVHGTAQHRIDVTNLCADTP